MFVMPTTLFSQTGPAPTTWNPADKSANITLSSLNLVATGTAAADSNVRSTTSKATGKFYVEMTTTAVGTGNIGFGVSNATAGLDALLGGDNNAWCSYATNQILLNGSTQSWFNYSWTDGDVLAYAIDFGLKHVWERRYRSGAWSDWQSAGFTGTPENGLAFGDFSSIAAGPYFFAAECRNNAVVVAKFVAAGMIGPIPTGYSAWG